MTDTEKDFLGRWSRRKQAVRESDGTVADAAAGEPDEASAAEDATAIDPADLPDIDSLDRESDFTAFMKEGVPEDLRVRALRKLWTTDPVLANLDGLNDYEENFGEILRTGAAAMRRIAAKAAELAEKSAGADHTETTEPAGESADDETERAIEPESGDGLAEAESRLSDPDDAAKGDASDTA